MCGIAGFLSFKSSFNESQLKCMTGILDHRGPDAEGVFFDGECGLGHRRLSIIDLSVAANQPMRSSCGRYIMVYNGEVYNYDQLTESLEKSCEWRKSDLKTTSDTEIILESFSKKGFDVINEFNGMFAIAVYDRYEKTIHLFRDRSGIKPLFYYWDGYDLIFGSELKVIQNALGKNITINSEAIGDYLHLGFIPAPYTIYRNVYKLLPATHLVIGKEAMKAKTFWSLTEQLTTETLKNEKEAISRLDSLIRDSVKLQMRSDVPFGVFLSSGTDSSLVAAKAAELSDNKLRTFSLGFENEDADESRYSRVIASHLQTEHHELIIGKQEVLASFEKSFDLYEEPIADASIIPTMILAGFAKKHVSVVLTGEGADELFFGYGQHLWARRLDSPFFKTLSKPMSMIGDRMSSRYQRISSLLKTNRSKNIISHIFSQEQYYFTHDEIELLVEPEYRQTHIQELISSTLLIRTNEKTKDHARYKTKRPLSMQEKQALFDQHYYLPDDLLVKVDRATMHHSLEARVPFLDHRIIEFALNLDPSLKIKNGQSKYLLKKILFNNLPQDLFSRPKKGFSIPLKHWLKNELRHLIDHYLSENKIREGGIFRQKPIEKLKEDFFGGKNYLFNRIWSIIILQHWIIKQKSMP